MKRRDARLSFKGACLAALLAAGGCAALVPIPAAPAVSEDRQEPVVLSGDPQDPQAERLMGALNPFPDADCSVEEVLGKTPFAWHDYAGVIHVHTNYSHDADGRLEDVIGVANAQGLDFVVVTDHNTLRALDEGRAGRYGNTLILVGLEISTEAGHYLAMNVLRRENWDELSAQEVVDAVAQQGGFGFIAHPYFEKHAWRDWSVRGFTGVEVYNVSHDAFEEEMERWAFWMLRTSPLLDYLSILRRPGEPLRLWDELIKRHGRLVGIGSTDAHEVHIMGMEFVSYEALFQMSRTHVLSLVSPLSPEAFYAALRSGHAYVCIDLLADPHGFMFRADAGGKTLAIMGDTVVLQPDLVLSAHSPLPCEFILYKDGKLLQYKTGQDLIWSVTEPGAYRVELTQGGKPWIFSNPIYVRSTPADGNSP